ncbi:TSUP family transporter [Candidatus Lokiarchaeum ossiferum]|uniref:TSUP family transporter n=1 Tax=Candidatus Lokiarchaeum ossiferum TaxID=2951803 RepID=UPI00352D30AC
MISLGLFALIFIPMVIIIGIAASTISFTSWSLVVPLLFGGFGFGIYEALFFAIVLDLLNGIVLSVRYAQIKEVDFKLGLISSIPMLIGAFGGFFLLQENILAHSEILKGGIGYLVLLVALLFLWKGKNDTEMQNIEENNNAMLEIQTKNSESSTFSLRLPKKWAISLLIIGLIISGALGGVVGAGSGMNYALLFMVFLNRDLMRATGTSSFMMAIVMIVALFLFMPLVNLSLIWSYLLIATIFTVIGTNIGLKYALQMSRAKLNYMVGFALLGTGIIAIIQAIVL